MNRRSSEDSPSPAVHSENIRRQLTELIEHLEADTGRVDDPRFRGLLKKSGEVLKGLRTLFEHFTPATQPTERQGKQPARQRDQTPERRDDAPSTQGSSEATGGGRSKGGAARAANAATKPAAKGKAAANTGGTASASRNKASRPAAAPAKGDKAGRPQNADSQSGKSRDVSEQANPAPANMAKPQDPDELNARVAIQRKEARAPILPAKSAPRPMPPQSGKPVWAKPHSS